MPDLYSVFQASQSYTVMPYVKLKTINKQINIEDIPGKAIFGISRHKLQVFT